MLALTQAFRSSPIPSIFFSFFNFLFVCKLMSYCLNTQYKFVGVFSIVFCFYSLDEKIVLLASVSGFEE